MGIDRSSGQPDEEPDRPREEPRPGEPADYRESVQAQPETRSRQQYYDVLVSGRGYEIVSFAVLIAERPASERREWQTPLRQGEVDDMQKVLDSYQPPGNGPFPAKNDQPLT